MVEIAITVMPLAALWLLMWAALDVSYWIVLLLAIPTAGFLVRVFILQHDCGHGSLFRGRRANDWTGRILGTLTLTPYQHWKHDHAIHHATSGRLERRGHGDVHTLTVEEYCARSRWGRLRYRLFRHPLVLFALGPAYLFYVQHRLPLGRSSTWQSWLSTMGTNLAIALAAAAIIRLVGVEAFLMVHVPITLMAASAGVWLFFVQHQFEHTSWDRDGAWDWHQAALHGSSHYDLPAILRWFTGNIGVHHVHHLCSQIPFYRLPRVLSENPRLRDVGRLTLLESFGCVRLVLWDETRRCLVSFRQVRVSG